MLQYDYVITLKRPDYKGFNWMNNILLFLSVLVFTYSAFNYKEARIFFSIVTGATLLVWLYYAFKPLDKDEIVFYRLALIIASIGWFHSTHGNVWIGGLLLVVAFLEKQVKFPQEIGFTQEGITFNTFPKKNYEWTEISNVILKDELLTIDFSNNKLLQKETEAGIAPRIEIEFNSYCKSIIQSSPVLSRTS
ncbi:MAG: hypothetical protein JWN76_1065 [Chitinophagaceae bacterium]|nr:hypothetical protein [Chitinophagaceae bacterium]